MDFYNVSLIGLNIPFAGLKSSLYILNIICFMVDIYALLEMTLDGTEDSVALTRYLVHCRRLL